MTDKETIKRRAAYLLIAQDKVTMPPSIDGNDIVTDVRNQVEEKVWRDALYNAWRCIMEEELGKLVSVYKVLAGEEE